MKSTVWRDRENEIRPFGNPKASDSANLDSAAEVWITASFSYLVLVIVEGNNTILFSALGTVWPLMFIKMGFLGKKKSYCFSVAGTCIKFKLLQGAFYHNASNILLCLSFFLADV